MKKYRKTRAFTREIVNKNLALYRAGRVRTHNRRTDRARAGTHSAVPLLKYKFGPPQRQNMQEIRWKENQIFSGAPTGSDLSSGCPFPRRW